MAHIFIIDDDKQQLIMFQAMLNPLAVDVSLFTSAEEALAEIEKAKPDVIVVDLGLPYMDGFTFIETLRKTNTLNPIPILVVTAQFTSFTPYMCQKLGIDIFLRKPISSQELRDGILRCLE